MYHGAGIYRYYENQLQQRLCGWSLVLYHLKLLVSPFLSPFLDIGITTTEITRLTGNPFLLGCLLASRLAVRTRAGTLSVANAMIGNEESAAKLAVFGQ